MLTSIVDYRPEWAAQFAQLKAVYQSVAGSLTEDILHVGSTSVPGLPAKPVLDIDLVISSDTMLAPLTMALEGIGYRCLGERGIRGRVAFRRVSAHTPEVGSGQLWPEHHLYACVKDSIALRNHLLFRDALLADDALAGRYGALKRSLARSCANMDQYVRGKTAFIASVLRDAGMDAGAVDQIIQENRSI